MRYLPATRPDDLPRSVLAALAKFDDLRLRADLAERDLVALTNTGRDTEAAETDRLAEQAAVAAGEPVPAGDAANTLAADRQRAAYAAEAHRTALHRAVFEVADVCTKVAERGEEAEQARRAEALTRLTEQAEALAAGIEAEHRARGRHEWLRTGSFDRNGPAVGAWEVVPKLAHLGLGVGMTDPAGATDHVAAVVRRVVAATFTEES